MLGSKPWRGSQSRAGSGNRQQGAGLGEDGGSTRPGKGEVSDTDFRGTPGGPGRLQPTEVAAFP